MWGQIGMNEKIVLGWSKSDWKQDFERRGLKMVSVGGGKKYFCDHFKNLALFPG